VTANREARRRRRLRLSLILGLSAVLLLTSAGAYAYYNHRRERNTRKLLSDAKEAVTAGDWEEAVACYNLYLRRNPADTNALVAYGDALLERTRESGEVLRETLRVLRRVVALNPTDPKPLAQLVSIYLQVGEFTQAEELAREWRVAAPDSTDAVLAVVRAQHGLHRYADAVAVLTEAIARRPTEPRFYAAIIEVLRDSLDQPERAAEWLEKSLEVAPEALEIQLAAFFHYRADAPEQAETHLRKALALAPDDLRGLVAASNFYLSRGRLDEADSVLRRAESTAPRHRAVLAARTAWAVKQSNPDPLSATADALTATADKYDLDLIARAGELYLRAGRIDRADECIERLAAAPRPTDVVLAWLETLRGAKLLMTGRPYAAIVHLDKALRREPQGLWAAELLAIAYVQTGAPGEAADLYRRILQTAPQLVAARLALARLELRQHRLTEAREQVRWLSPVTGAEDQQVRLIRAICDLRAVPKERRTPQDLPDAYQQVGQVAAARPEGAAAVELLMQALILAGPGDAALDALLGYKGDSMTTAWLGAELGRLLLAENRLDTAGRLAQQWSARFPSAYEGHALRIRVLAAADRLAEAKAYVETSPTSGAALGKLWELLADQFSLAGDANSSVDALRRAAPLLPADIDVRHKLIRQIDSLTEAMALVEEIRLLEGSEGAQWRFERAWSLLRHDRQASAKQALDLLKQCLSVRPGWVPARLLMGSAYEALGDWNEAADAYRTAITHDPHLATDTVAIRLIEVLKRMGRFAEADTALTPLVAALPDSPEVLRLEMDKQLRARSISSAAAVAERILELSGDDPAWAAVAADLQLRAGNALKAEQMARSALTAHPDSASLITSVTRALIAQERSTDAEEFVRAFATRMNDGLSHILLAQMLVFMRKETEAESAIAAALERGPSDPVVLAAAADFWGARGQRARQVTLARRAVELRKESPAESLTLATLLATGGDAAERAEAQAVVQTRLMTNPNDTAALLLAAQLAATGRPPDYAVAEKSAQKALHVDPRSIDAHKTLAAIQGRSGRITPAEETVTAALAVAPDDPELLLTSIQLLCHRGEYEQALLGLRRLLRLRPRSPEALRLFAAAGRFAGQTDQAITYIEQQAPREHWTPLELVLLAKLRESKGEGEKAAELFTGAFERDPRSPEIFQEYVHFLSRAGAHDQVYALASKRRMKMPQDVDSIAVAAELLGTRSADSSQRQTAVGWLREIAAAHPDHAADAHYRAGLCYYQIGDWKNAEDFLTKAAQIEPNSARAVNALAWLYCEKLTQPQKALSLIEGYLARGGLTTAELLDTFGTVLLRLDRLDAARDKLLACLDLAGQTPTYAAANYHLGLVLLRLDSPSEAQSYLRQALQLHKRVGGLTDDDLKEAQRLLAETGS